MRLFPYFNKLSSIKTMTNCILFANNFIINDVQFLCCEKNSYLPFKKKKKIMLRYLHKRCFKHSLTHLAVQGKCGNKIMINTIMTTIYDGGHKKISS